MRERHLLKWAAFFSLELSFAIIFVYAESCETKHWDILSTDRVQQRLNPRDRNNTSYSV
jgi:hypothetical protein